MKRTLALLFLAALPFVSIAQEKEEETNCYIKWAQKFEDRGAENVEDGVYTDVVITFRSGSSAECFNGKAEVKDGKVIGMYLRLEDGSYEPVTRKWKYEIKEVTIINGISKTLITKDDVLINVLFIKKIKPKKKGYEKAPDPSAID
jgi:hypothetical protein